MAEDALEQTPFRKTIIKSFESRTPIGVPEDDDDHVIRLAYLNKVDGKPNQVDLEERRKLKELRSFGINVPNFDLVIGPPTNGDTYMVYSVVDRVHGSNLEHASLPREVAEQFLENLLRYYEEKLSKGEEFLYDMHLEEFMYGKVKGDAEDRIYLVDLDPKLKSDPFEFFARVSGYILEMIDGLEQSSGGTKFIKVRESNYNLYKMAGEKLPRKRVYFLSEEERIRKMYMGENEVTGDKAED